MVKHTWHRGLMGGVLLLLPMVAGAVSLPDYRWQNRPLLLFAPDAADTRLQQTLQVLSVRQCELDDRQMITGVILGQGESLLDGKPVTSEQATSLRKRFDLSATDFAVLLIGKDGGEKYRVQTPPELERIFALIDGMPMRIEEMRNNPVDCNTAARPDYN